MLGQVMIVDPPSATVPPWYTFWRRACHSTLLGMVVLGGLVAVAGISGREDAVATSRVVSSFKAPGDPLAHDIRSQSLAFWPDARAWTKDSSRRQRPKTDPVLAGFVAEVGEQVSEAGRRSRRTIAGRRALTRERSDALPQQNLPTASAHDLVFASLDNAHPPPIAPHLRAYLDRRTRHPRDPPRMAVPA